MKKMIGYALAGVMAMGLFGCGQAGAAVETETAAQTEEIQTDETAMTEATIQTETETEEVVDPVEELDSMEDLVEAVNCAVIKPEKVEVKDEHFAAIHGGVADSDDLIGEYTFKADGKVCTLRCGDVEPSIDISGVYEGEAPLFKDADKETYFIEHDALSAIRWYTVDGQYTLVVDDAGDWDWTQFDVLASQFINMTPKNWTSDVKFEDYQKLAGYYDGGGEYYAGVSMCMDHVLVVAGTKTDEGHVHWEAEAVLDGGKLTYEKETCSLLVYDEETGETKTQRMENGKEGSILVQGNTLNFNGVNLKAMKNRTFRKLNK